MSLLPVLYDELSDPYYRRWEDFDLRLRRELEAHPSVWPLIDYHPRWNRVFTDLGTASLDKDRFKVRLDVEPFRPWEITCKTVDNAIVIDGKRTIRKDGNNFVKREFTRRYTVPDGYDVKDAISKLSSDGILTVEAPAERKLWWPHERVLPIERTGLPARW